MDATLKAIVGLIGGVDVETRCAALLVLSHLRAADEAIVKAVGEALSGKNAVVRDFAIGYLEQVRPRHGLAYLLPFLDGEDEALRQRAVAILAHYGQPAVNAAKKLLPDAPRRRLNAVIELCAHVRSAAAFDLLFGLLAGTDFDANRTACDALLAALPSADESARSDLFARTEMLAKQAKAPRSALIAAAKLFGALADARARRPLFGMLEAKHPHAVRTHALAALQHCLRGQKLLAKEIDVLMPLLEEDDELGILRPTIHLLDPQSLDRPYLPQLDRLAESQQPLVKRFAVHKLAGFESTAVVKTLISYLTDDSFARRDEAGTSLKKMPAARTALMKELLACTDERKAWALADILLAHDRDWPKKTIEELGRRLESAIEEREDRLYTAYFHFLNAVAPALLAAQVRLRAQQRRKAKDFAGAARWLGLIKDSPAFDVDTAYDLALADLKAHPRRIAAAPRKHDVALDLFRELSASPMPLAERLRKERVLTPDELLYVAFGCAEGRGAERGLARDLLEHLVGKHGRTKAGKAAKNKLRLLSHPE
ncbi:MAG: lyase domain protein repeat-containing protein [Deltaproteobacteria bacterium]|nr:lyase domain protein repeat-containing protein [Deltaproteobacteria bacterium]